MLEVPPDVREPGTMWRTGGMVKARSRIAILPGRRASIFLGQSVESDSDLAGSTSLRIACSV
jgi:hypothetical protein